MLEGKSLNERQKSKPREYRRSTGFALGLVIALSCFFAAMEYTSRGGTSDDETLLEDFSSDIDQLPTVDMKDMIPAAVPVSGVEKQKTAHVKVVEQIETVAETVSDDISDVAVVQGVEGAVSNSLVEESTEQTPVQAEAPVDLKVLEQLPEFPGGMVEFMKWLNSNLRYPQGAQRRKAMGKVVVSFLINKDGSITNAKIEKSASPELDAEALRVVRLMPRWKPGMSDNKPCRTMFAIPIIFQI